MRQPGLRALNILLFLLIMLAYRPLLSAAPPVNTDNFRYFGDVLPGAVDTTGFFILEVPPEVYASMDPSLRDLRIYNNDGQEIGYTLLAKPPAQQSRYEECEIINKGPLEETDKYSFTIKDLPSDAEKITVKLDKSEYLVKSEISGSNDNQIWQSVGTQTLYGISGNYNVFSLRDVFYRYIKFTFSMPPGENLNVSSVQHMRKTTGKKPEQLPFPLTQSEANKSSIIIIDLGYNNYNSRSLTLTTAGRNFYRRATLEAGNNREQWRHVSSFYLYRGIDRYDENLSIEYPLTQARYLKITLQNGDNRPVEFTGATMETDPVRLLVKESPDRAPFKVYWGNTLLTAPLYDIHEILAQGKVNPYSLRILRLGDYTENPSYKKPAPAFSERYPFLLPLALVIAILILGVIQFKSIKKINS